MAEAHRRPPAAVPLPGHAGRPGRSRRCVTIRSEAGERPRGETLMQETSKVWRNGELVDWADATVHVGTHGLHYGTGVFEGIRCYDTDKGPAVFRLTDHLQRLHNSARLLYMDLPYSVEELHAASMEVIGVNG